MTSTSYDLIIIGTGAGGGTMLHALAPTGARILVLERGEAVPREDHNWDPVAVWKDLRYRTTETWLDEHGGHFVPYMHYGLRYPQMSGNSCTITKSEGRLQSSAGNEC